MRLRLPLLKATYEWLLDEGLTPYFLVNTEDPSVVVPQDAIEEGLIVLDASVDAVDNMHFDEEGVSFEASFDGEITEIFFPIHTIQALYAEETDQGIFLTDSPNILLIQEGNISEPMGAEEDEVELETAPEPVAKVTRGHLKLVK
jgi:stringent starvation protein B